MEVERQRNVLSDETGPYSETLGRPFYALYSHANMCNSRNLKLNCTSETIQVNRAWK